MAKDTKPTGPAIPTGPAAKDELPKAPLTGGLIETDDDRKDSPADPQADRIAAMQAQIDRLTALVTSNAVNAVGVIQDEKSRAEQAVLQAEAEKGVERRSQEEADRQYPSGRFRFVCHLPDGNGHPRLVISADNEVDAAARYQSVCGIRSTDKQVQVTRA